MKQIIRLNDISSEDLLAGYHLSIHEREIIYVQSLSWRSLHAVAELFSCVRKPDSGTFIVNGKKYESADLHLMRSCGIYCPAFGEEFNEHMSVAENLIMNAQADRWYQVFSRRDMNRKADAFLKQYHLCFDVSAPVSSLSAVERRKLSLLRARYLGMRLAVIEVTSHTDEGYHQQEIIDLIRQLNEEGMSFLILASRFSPAAESASRIQYVRYGMAVREWYECNSEVLDVLSGTSAAYHPAGSTSKSLSGIFDEEWTDDRNIWEYLLTVKKENPEAWEKYLNFTIPAEDESSDGHTVIIPRDSYAHLIRELSIAENLTIAMGRRVLKGAVIQKQIERRLEREFREQYGVDPKVKQIDGLNRLQKKILSIERFARTKPDTIILEDPFRSVHLTEQKQLQAYLEQLSAQGIRIICFSRVPAGMAELCHTIFETSNCKNFHLL